MFRDYGLMWGELRSILEERIEGLEKEGDPEVFGMYKVLKMSRQVKFVLIPSQRDENGKVIERECSYKADFKYEEDGKTVVEDVKGFRTKEYIIKRKLLLYQYGIRIREV